MRIAFALFFFTFLSVNTSFAQEGHPHASQASIEMKEHQAVIKEIEEDESRLTLMKEAKKIEGEKLESLGPLGKSLEHTVINDLNKKIIEHIDAFAKILFQATHAIAHFPSALWQTLKHATHPPVKNMLVDFALVLLLSIGFGYLAELCSRLVLFRFLRAPIPPISLGRFTLYLSLAVIPLLVFGITSSFVAHALNKPNVLSNALIVIGFIFMTRLVLRYFKLLLQPNNTQLRAIPLNDDNAKRFYGMVRLLLQVLFFSTLFGQVFILLGISQIHYEIWHNITGFLLLLIVASLIIDYRAPVAEWLKQDDLHFISVPRILVGLVNVFARTWYIITLGFMVTFYLAWVYDALDQAMLLLRSVTLTVILVTVFRTLSYRLNKHAQKVKLLLQGVVHHEETNHNDAQEETLLPSSQSTLFFLPLAQVGLYIATFVIALEIWGLNLLALLNNPSIQKHLLTGFSIVLVIFVARILLGLIDLISKSHLQTYYKGRQKIEPSLFAKTITPILRSTLKATVVFLTFLVVLSELSVDIMPIVYAFSVISLAISFGAQTMVKDLITGFLYLFEGNIAVGEVVQIGSHKGMVEAITLRSVFLRHSNGSIQSIPFSEVNYITNLSRDYTDHAIIAYVAHATSVKLIYDVLAATFQQIKSTPRWASEIIGDIKIHGIESFADAAIKVSGSVTTRPDPKSYFIKEFNALLQDNMLAAGIMPPTQVQLVLGGEKAA